MAKVDLIGRDGGIRTPTLYPHKDRLTASINVLELLNIRTVDAI